MPAAIAPHRAGGAPPPRSTDSKRSAAAALFTQMEPCKRRVESGYRLVPATGIFSLPFCDWCPIW
eukprot:602497-Prorocentrum_minimum.AAC.2